MAPVCFQYYPQASRNQALIPGPRETHFRDWFARDSPLQRRVRRTSVLRRGLDVVSRSLITLLGARCGNDFTAGVPVPANRPAIVPALRPSAFWGRVNEPQISQPTAN